MLSNCVLLLGNLFLGAVHKIHPQAGGRWGLSRADIFRTREKKVLQMRTMQTSTHFGEKKSSDFLKFMVCPHGQGGYSVY